MVYSFKHLSEVLHVVTEGVSGLFIQIPVRCTTRCDRSKWYIHLNTCQTYVAVVLFPLSNDTFSNMSLKRIGLLFS